MKIEKYNLFLLAIFIAVWIWAAIEPNYREAWLTENILVFIGFPLFLIASYFFKFSKTSYTLITMFMVFHLVGSHYTYGETPFGYLLQDWLGTDRNMYDRLVHFLFGFLLVYPVRELFMRISQTKGFWSYWFPVELVLGLSGLFEIIEWMAAITLNPEVGLAYVGAQGDIWDAQKDMALATAGAIITMLIVFFINLFYNENHKMEIAESLIVPKDDELLGEVKLSKMIKAKKNR